MKKRYKVLIYGKYTLTNRQRIITFESEEQAHELMAVNFAEICDYKVVEV